MMQTKSLAVVLTIASVIAASSWIHLATAANAPVPPASMATAHSPPLTARMPRFPDKPAEVGHASWSALQHAVANISSSPELTGSDGAASDYFGAAVAISGTTALVGAYGKNSQRGAAYVFSFDGKNWVQQQELIANDGAMDDAFGMSVALSGTTALVGAFLKPIGIYGGQGAVYVFNFNGSTWVQTQELTESDGTFDDSFGYSVALLGNTALIGAESSTIGSTLIGQGSAYLFTFDGASWIQKQELTASDPATADDFGISVALSGTTALIGAAYKSIGSTAHQGAAYVFSFDGSNWVQQQKLTASDGATLDQFGCSVALSGNMALVGAFNKSIESNAEQGAAYVFQFDGANWIQQQQLTASDGAAGDEFGAAVALSGTTALVGALGKTVGVNTRQGVAYSIEDSSGQWIQTQELTASDGAAGDVFGAEVALSGSTALIGANLKTIGSNAMQGAAYVLSPVSDTVFRDGFEGAGM